MYFKLVDGKPVWATHYKDGEYFYEGDDVPEDAEEVEQPSQEVKERAEKLKGKTFSRTQFQRMLENPSTEEILAKVTEITTRQMVKEEKLSEEELLFLVNLYPKYRVGKEYKEGDIFNYQGKLYEVLQNHTSQEDWKPDEAGSLYVSRMPEGVIPEWQQPTGSHDAYNTGDKVTYEGKVWTSLIDGNTTVPDGDEPHNRYWEPEN